jgi:hypothetical protein
VTKIETISYKISNSLKDIIVLSQIQKDPPPEKQEFKRLKMRAAYENPIT